MELCVVCSLQDSETLNCDPCVVLWFTQDKAQELRRKRICFVNGLRKGRELCYNDCKVPIGYFQILLP